MAKKKNFNIFSMTLRDKQTEKDFLEYNLETVKKITFYTLTIFNINNLILIINQIFSPYYIYSEATVIMIARSVCLIYGVIILFKHKSLQHFKQYKILIFIYICLLGAANTAIHFSYPEPESIKYAFEIMIILGIYLAFPIGLIYQTVGALIFSISMFISLDADVQPLITYTFALGMMINSNIIGFISARYYQKIVRKMYLVLNIENKLKERREDALLKLKTISGLVPICRTCKSVQNVDGYWNKIEQFITTHSDIKLTHGLCPECSKRMMNEIDDYSD